MGLSLNDPEACWLCGRPLGSRVERHHPLPRSRGGRDTVAVHPICHRMMHNCFTNVELTQLHKMGKRPADASRMQRFLAWIANKPPDFHAATRGGDRKR